MSEACSRHKNLWYKNYFSWSANKWRVAALTCRALSPPGGSGPGRRLDVHSKQGRGWRHCGYSGHRCDTAGRSASGARPRWTGCRPTGRGSERGDWCPGKQSDDYHYIQHKERDNVSWKTQDSSVFIVTQNTIITPRCLSLYTTQIVFIATLNTIKTPYC